jgi:arylsulfatase A-like enzyme
MSSTSSARPRPRRSRRRTAALAALVAVAGCAREGGREPAAPDARNAILVSIDTLRADHLGTYGHGPPTSPRIDALAAQGVVFEDASSTAPWTLPAHASLLTGLYPSGHGVRTATHRLGDDVPTLAEVLSGRGYDTAAFVNAYFMESRFGLARGFDVYEIYPEAQGRRALAPTILGHAKDWLRARGDEPFFLFVHLFDVHSDYRPFARYEEMFTRGPGRYHGGTMQIMMGIRGDIPLERSDADHLAALYDGGIRQLDDDLAALPRALPHTLLIVTSDHGEEFLEHGGMLHGGTHYQEQLHVPLILVGPGLPAGTRVATPVSLVDLMPTVLDLLGAPAPPGMDGQSLRPLWEGRDDSRDGRAILAETGPAEDDALRSLRRGRFKLIEDVRTGAHELYDLAADPGETQDLAASRPGIVREMSGRLGDLARPRRRAPELPPPSPEVKARLRSLGYLDD